MGLSLVEGRNVGGGISGGGDLRLPPPEHSFTVYCDQAHCVPVSGIGSEAGVKGDQAVVESVRTRCEGGGVGGGLGGEMEREGGGGRRTVQKW